MCQLSIGNLENKKLNAILASSILLANTRTDHKDGFGIYVPGNNKIIRDGGNPWEISFTESLYNTIDNKFFMAHVRKASNRTMLGKDFAHPFVSKSFIFAHNGTLDLQVGNIPVNTLDSYHFLTVLESKYNGNIVESLNTAMAEFEGKFAFVIFERLKKEMYVVRGRTALLYRCDISTEEKNLGYIINTEFESIKNIKQMFSSFSGMVLKETIPSLIEMESIFSLSSNGELTKLGTIKENEPKTTYWGYPRTPNTNRGLVVSGQLSVQNTLIKKLVDVQIDWALTPSYVDELHYQVTGKYLFASTEKTVEYLLDFIKYTESALPSKKKDLIDVWRKLIRNSSDFELHNRYGLEFPYWINNASTLSGVLEMEEKRYNEIPNN
jgi:predicted glutamine amidotransferase